MKMNEKYEHGEVENGVKQVLVSAMNEAKTIDFRVHNAKQNTFDYHVDRKVQYVKTKKIATHLDRRKHKKCNSVTIARTGWKCRLTPSHQKIARCRNFRIVLFDIAFKPELKKHVVAYKARQSSQNGQLPTVHSCDLENQIETDPIILQTLEEREYCSQDDISASTTAEIASASTENENASNESSFQSNNNFFGFNVTTLKAAEERHLNLKEKTRESLVPIQDTTNNSTDLTESAGSVRGIENGFKRFNSAISKVVQTHHCTIEEEASTSPAASEITTSELTGNKNVSDESTCILDSTTEEAIGIVDSTGTEKISKATGNSAEKPMCRMRDKVVGFDCVTTASHQYISEGEACHSAPEVFTSKSTENVVISDELVIQLCESNSASTKMAKDREQTNNKSAVVLQDSISDSSESDLALNELVFRIQNQIIDFDPATLRTIEDCVLQNTEEDNEIIVVSENTAGNSKNNSACETTYKVKSQSIEVNLTEAGKKKHHEDEGNVDELVATPIGFTNNTTDRTSAPSKSTCQSPCQFGPNAVEKFRRNLTNEVEDTESISILENSSSDLNDKKDSTSSIEEVSGEKSDATGALLPENAFVLNRPSKSPSIKANPVDRYISNSTIISQDFVDFTVVCIENSSENDRKMKEFPLQFPTTGTSGKEFVPHTQKEDVSNISLSKTTYSHGIGNSVIKRATDLKHLQEICEDSTSTPSKKKKVGDPMLEDVDVVEVGISDLFMYQKSAPKNLFCCKTDNTDLKSVDSGNEKESCSVGKSVAAFDEADVVNNIEDIFIGDEDVAVGTESINNESLRSHADRNTPKGFLNLRTSCQPSGLSGLRESSATFNEKCENLVSTKIILQNKMSDLNESVSIPITNEVHCSRDLENMPLERNAGKQSTNKIEEFGQKFQSSIAIVETASSVKNAANKNCEADNKVEPECVGAVTDVTRDRQPINEGISQIKITKVISIRNRDTNSGDTAFERRKESDNEKTLEKSVLIDTIVTRNDINGEVTSDETSEKILGIGQEHDSRIRLEQYDHCEFENIEKSQYSSVGTPVKKDKIARKKKSKTAGMVGVASDYNPMELENIILKIISGLSPQSSEIPTSSNQHFSSNNGSQIEQLQPREQILPKLDSNSKVCAVDHSYSYLMKDTMLPIINSHADRNTPKGFLNLKTTCQPSALSGLRESSTTFNEKCENLVSTKIILQNERSDVNESVSLPITNEVHCSRDLENVPLEGNAGKQLNNEIEEFGQKFPSSIIHEQKNNENGPFVPEKSGCKGFNSIRKMRNPWFNWNKQHRPTYISKKTCTLLKKTSKRVNSKSFSNQKSGIDSTAAEEVYKLPLDKNQASSLYDHAYTRVASHASENRGTVRNTVDQLPHETSERALNTLSRPESSIPCLDLQSTFDKSTRVEDIYAFEDDEQEKELISNKSKVAVKRIPEAMDVKPVICWKCGASSKCERMFGMHFTSLHLDSSVLQCLYCPEEFQHEENDAFEQHYVAHLRQKDEEKRKKVLQDIWKSENDDLGAYMKVFSKYGSVCCCLKCNHRTATSQTMELHLQQVHHVSSKRTFSCDFCNLHFSSGIAKRFHSLSKHRDRMSRCKYCYWLYMMKSSYYVHLRTCPVYRIEENQMFSEAQKRMKMDLWWTENDVKSDNWMFEHDGKLSEKRQVIAAQRLSLTKLCLD